MSDVLQVFIVTGGMSGGMDLSTTEVYNYSGDRPVECDWWRVCPLLDMDLGEQRSMEPSSWPVAMLDIISPRFSPGIPS